MNLEQQLAHHVLQTHPKEAARTLERLEIPVAATVLDTLAPALGANILACMMPHEAAAVVSELALGKRIEIVQAAPASVAVWLLRRLPSESRDPLLNGLDPRRARRLTRAIAMREGTAGAMVDPDALALRAELTVQEVIDQHREALIEASHALPVVDEEHHLVGMVELEELRAPQGTRTISSIMQTRFVSVPGHFDRQGIVAHPGWREASAIPVVDREGVFLGMLDYEHLRALERELLELPASANPSTSRALGDLFGTAVGGFLDALVTFSGGTRDAR